MTTDPERPGIAAPTQSEAVVLLDDDGHAIGIMDKRSVHHADTPLHLAFSCYLFDDDGRVLITRRALHKHTFAGVWTNACCGHPAPGEALDDAVRRRVRQELAVEIEDLRLLLPAFRYVAEQDGVMENEMCPVFAARVTNPAAVQPDPEEVADACWESWPTFRHAVLSGSRAVSTWCREQIRQLPADPASAIAVARDALPPAAQHP
ncbi:isopentenyl-diphosphate Delta-isomerase [Aeromicrobium sp.]|uniref:isopentenyl-diphosphate Delta-isomerase n=1 Tax=Aeromicrobium sp. TaxID=1871063 RepID=UPI0025B8269B|nr:isopentenyl-diphosphate Delta-isomerase [Aeromicrobium sp.]MCK5891790.1 isopentenyl-diphosphate Delta-isomerase [Aeromicrobium sp.]